MFEVDGNDPAKSRDSYKIEIQDPGEEAERVNAEVRKLEHVRREITVAAGIISSTGHLTERYPFIASLESQ